MKKTLLAAACLVLSAFPTFAHAVECVDVYETRVGNACSTPNSFSAKYRNSCIGPVDIKICLERANGSWDCGTNLQTQPGKGSSYYICNGTGRYQHAWRDAGSKARFSIP